MYLEHFGFREPPFSITPNPRFVFLSTTHREAFAHLLYGIRSSAGFIALTGEVGTGKTTVIRSLLSQLADDAHRTALIFNPYLTGRELLRTINREFGLLSEQNESDDVLEELNRFLLAENSAGRRVVLVIDEAQNLSTDVLEQLRLISNLETTTDKLLQIILVGQPELLSMLEREELRQLNQRITVRYHLTPLDFGDTEAYIAHRLQVAGFWGRELFSSQALRKVYRSSRGLPRLINVTCDRALLVAYSEESRQVTAPTVATAARELRLKRQVRAHIPIIIGLTLIPLFALFFFLFRPWHDKSPIPAQVPSSVSLQSMTASSTPLWSVSEEESIRTAFNAVSPLWGGKITPHTAPPQPLTVLASEQGLMLSRVSGTFDTLLTLDVPAIIPITQPDQTGRRYLALINVSGDDYAIAPPLAGRSTLKRQELELLWRGEALIPWRNYYQLSALEGVKESAGVLHRVQELLRTAGYADVGVGADGGIEAAVQQFQADRGIIADGRVGGITLLLLYQASPHFPVPRLATNSTGGR
ncbi:MAG TPA: AAA family ATPase [Geobacterales bacterium]|nr:AAA family ATPase [Geobacterales bacterium]